MNTYAKEYLDMMVKLKVVFKKMKDYDGSERDMNTLENCVKNGKKLYADRGILNEKQITQNFGCIKEMIIRRQKVLKTLEYLEECIKAERKFWETCELEEETIDGLIAIMKIYNDEVNDDESCSDETWEKIIKVQTDTVHSILAKMDHNELSHSIHKQPIVTTLQVVVEGIHEHQEGRK